MKNPDIFVLSLICRANIFSLRFKTLHAWNCCKNHHTKTNANLIACSLIWYHFILNSEISVWNFYFLNENILHVNNKNKPCLLTRIILFLLSPKVAALLFVNSQIGAFAFAKIWCSDKLAAMSVQRYISSVFRLFYLNRFICICIYLKPNEETNALERKAIINFWFGKTETSAQAGMELWRATLLFLYPLKLFNCRKRRISWLFCKVNSLIIA